jgi:hypothetical protein
MADDDQLAFILRSLAQLLKRLLLEWPARSYA